MTAAIDMAVYRRLGPLRREWDAWLYEVGLMPGNRITEIRFGEGVHELTGWESDEDGKTVTVVLDGHHEPVRRRWTWAGPLPPSHLLEKLRTA